MLAARHIATPAGTFVSQLVLRKQRNEVPENRRNSLHKGLLQTSVSLVLHTGLLPSPLISDALLFGRLWYGEPDAISNAIDYAKFYSRSYDAVIRVYDDAGNRDRNAGTSGRFQRGIVNGRAPPVRRLRRLSANCLDMSKIL